MTIGLLKIDVFEGQNISEIPHFPQWGKSDIQLLRSLSCLNTTIIHSCSGTDFCNVIAIPSFDVTGNSEIQKWCKINKKSPQ